MEVSKATDLIGKVAVVTGASSGIGRAIAVTLAGEGVKVALEARRLDLLEDNVKKIKSKGGQAIPVKTDVVDKEQVKNLVAETEKAFGPVDFLINNAGYFYITQMTSLLEDTWEKTIDVNCKGVMNGIGAVLDGMVKRRRGHIVTISSDAGRFVHRRPWFSPSRILKTYRSTPTGADLRFRTMSKATDLIGKVAVVTGASSGIGRAIAVTLAGEGVKVALGARRLDLLEEIVKEIKAKGGQAIPIKTDVVDRQQVKNLVAETEKAFGPVDFLINNAGYYYITQMTSLLEDTWEKTIDVNCKGVMNGIGAVLDGMVKRRHGHIVTISSDSGRFADPGLTVYTGTKFFVEGMSQSLRQEVARYGIKVTTIQPGYVDTEGLRRPQEKEAVEKFIHSGQITMLTSEEVARTVIYALSQPPNVSVGEILVQPLEQLVI